MTSHPTTMEASSGEEIVMGSVVSMGQRESPPTQRRKVGAVLVEGQYAEERTPPAPSLLQTSSKRKRLDSEGHDTSSSGSQSIGTESTSNGAGPSSEGMDALDDDNDDIFRQLDSGDGGSDERTQTQGDLETSLQQSHDSRTEKNILNETNMHCAPPLRAPDHALIDDLDRFTVTQFLHRGKETGNNINVVYEIRCSKKGTVSKLILRDLWVHMPILDIGTVINVCHRAPDENGDYVIERDFGFVIVDPDKLISVTNVVGMSWCERKIAFSEHFRLPVNNMDMLRGNIAHDLIVRVMDKKKFEPQEILAEVDQSLRHPAILKQAEALGLVRLSSSAELDSSVKLKSLGHELVSYVEPIKDCMKPVDLNKNGPRKMQITKIVDIEDCYWSPKYGLKGRVDCTVETIDSRGQKSIIPMEFKTGQPNTRNTEVRSEHLGQVFLYSLLMGKIDMAGPNGLLYYIRNMNSVETSTKMNILQSLIMARNRIIFNLASNAAGSGFEGLPRPVNVDFNRHCNTCEYRNICALSLTEPTENESPWSETETKLRGSLSHLSQPEMDILTEWLRVIKLKADEDALSYSSRNLWIQPISKRESAGKCIGYLAIIDQQIVVPASGETFVKFFVQNDRQKFLLNFAEKDFVVIGTLQDTCIGFSHIEDISMDTITVSFDRPILGRHAAKTTKFTIDKISSREFSAGSIQYVHLSQIMEDNAKSKNRRRHLILKQILTNYFANN